MTHILYKTSDITKPGVLVGFFDRVDCAVNYILDDLGYARIADHYHMPGGTTILTARKHDNTIDHFQTRTNVDVGILGSPLPDERFVVVGDGKYTFVLDTSRNDTIHHVLRHGVTWMKGVEVRNSTAAAIRRIVDYEDGLAEIKKIFHSTTVIDGYNKGLGRAITIMENAIND